MENVTGFLPSLQGYSRQSEKLLKGCSKMQANQVN